MAAFQLLTLALLSDTYVVYDQKQILLNLWPGKAINLTVQAPASEFAFLISATKNCIHENCLAICENLKHN